MSNTLKNVVEQRFQDELTQNGHSIGPNKIAHDLFFAIQSAFMPNYKERWYESTLVHPELIQNLAACASVALTYSDTQEINWDHHDFVFNEVLRFFMKTLREAISEGRVQELEGRYMHGCFQIPRWYYDFCHQQEVAANQFKKTLRRPEV